MTKKVMIPLKDFVSDTLAQIIEGVVQAQEKTAGKGKICPLEHRPRSR